jgi:putative DNA primase/helicase
MNTRDDALDLQEFFKIEPSEEVVSPIQLYGALKTCINHFVKMTEDECVSVVLWILHTYFIRKSKKTQVCEFSPILLINSPEKGCGKSTLTEVLACLTPRSLQAMNASEAALFRVISADLPTLFIDEADTFVVKRPEIFNIFNSGYRQDGCVIRQTGKNYEITQKFETWGAKCIAGIGNLPDTIESRCIKVRLKKKLPSETLSRKNEVLQGDPNFFTYYCRQMVRFAIDFEQEIIDLKIDYNPDLDDRCQDNWSGLMKIAKFIDDTVFEEASVAAKSLSKEEVFEVSERIELLKDVYDILICHASERISSEDLCKQLHRLQDRPWATYTRGGLNQHQLSLILRPFGIYPNQLKFGQSNKRGYEKSDFVDTFARYLGK